MRIYIYTMHTTEYKHNDAENGAPQIDKYFTFQT